MHASLPLNPGVTCRGPWRFAPIIIDYGGRMLVLLNFETTVYFSKINK
jgi:hypothetical protein